MKASGYNEIPFFVLINDRIVSLPLASTDNISCCSDGLQKSSDQIRRKCADIDTTLCIREAIPCSADTSSASKNNEDQERQWRQENSVCESNSITRLYIAGLNDYDLNLTLSCLESRLARFILIKVLRRQHIEMADAVEGGSVVTRRSEEVCQGGVQTLGDMYVVAWIICQALSGPGERVAISVPCFGDSVKQRTLANASFFAEKAEQEGLEKKEELRSFVSYLSVGRDLRSRLRSSYYTQLCERMVGKLVHSDNSEYYSKTRDCRVAMSWKPTNACATVALGFLDGGCGKTALIWKAIIAQTKGARLGEDVEKRRGEDLTNLETKVPKNVLGEWLQTLELYDNATAEYLGLIKHNSKWSRILLKYKAMLPSSPGFDGSPCGKSSNLGKLIPLVEKMLCISSERDFKGFITSTVRSKFYLERMSRFLKVCQTTSDGNVANDTEKDCSLFGSAWNVLNRIQIIADICELPAVATVRAGEKMLYELAEAIAGRLGVELIMEHSPTVPASCLEVDGRTLIYLHEGLNLRQRAWAIFHEIAHLSLGHDAASEYGLDSSILTFERRKHFDAQENDADKWASIWCHLLDFTKAGVLAQSPFHNDKNMPSEFRKMANISTRMKYSDKEMLEYINARHNGSLMPNAPGIKAMKQSELATHG